MTVCRMKPAKPSIILLVSVCHAAHASAFANARSALAALLAERAPRRVWLPAYACLALADATTGLAAETRFCSECGRPSPAHEMVTIGAATICAQCKPLYMQRVREGGQPIGVRRYAGFWIRFVARLIDGIILAVVGFIINLPIQMALGLSATRMTGDVSAADVDAPRSWPHEAGDRSQRRRLA